MDIGLADIFYILMYNELLKLIHNYLFSLVFVNPQRQRHARTHARTHTPAHNLDDYRYYYGEINTACWR